MCNRAYFEDFEDDEKRDLHNQMLNQKRYQSHYFAHPECQDPDHPGCSNCEPEEYDNEN